MCEECMAQQREKWDLSLQSVKTKEESEKIACLAETIWAEYYTPIIGAEQVRYMLDRFQSKNQIWQDVTERGFVYIYLTVADKPAAYMAFQDQPDATCFLSKLYVLKDFRRQGFSKILIDYLVLHCQNENKHQIFLTVHKKNLQSIAVYKKMMFRLAEPIVTDIGQGFVMDDYIMRRDLT